MTPGTRWSASAPHPWTCWSSAVPDPPAGEGGMTRGPRRLAAIRPDGMGDVLLTGPAVRAMSRAGRVAFLAGPAGAAAAALLPGVHRVICCVIPWIEPD